MKNTPRDVILQMGALIALYLSIAFLLALVFGLINVTFPIATDSYWEIENATESIRYGIAMLIVFFPTYVLLTRYVQRFRRESDSVYQGVTRWLVYLSLLVGGFVLLITLVTTIYTFLGGDITFRFLLKAGTIALVTLTAFYYYFKDLGDYWTTHETQSKLWGTAVSLFVLLVIVLGFMNIETPTEVREMKIDEQQLNDLRNIQWQIESYLETSTTTPVSLTEVYRDTDIVPTAPEGREEYSYDVTPQGFKLCATFSRDYTDPYYSNARPVFDSKSRIKQPENWNYKAGRHCFERVVEQ